MQRHQKRSTGHRESFSIQVTDICTLLEHIHMHLFIKMLYLYTHVCVFTLCFQLYVHNRYTIDIMNIDIMTSVIMILISIISDSLLGKWRLPPSASRGTQCSLHHSTSRRLYMAQQIEYVHCKPYICMNVRINTTCTYHIHLQSFVYTTYKQTVISLSRERLIIMDFFLMYMNFSFLSHFSFQITRDI